MALRNKWRWGVAVIGILVVCLIVLSGRPRPSIRAPNGSAIQFLGATEVHTPFAFGTAFEKAWGMVMKERVFFPFGIRIGGPHLVRGPGMVNVHFLTEHVSPSGSGNSMSPNETFIEGVRITFIGITNMERYGSGISGVGLGGGRGICSFGFAPLPTDAGIIHVIATTRSNSVELGRFQIPVR